MTEFSAVTEGIRAYGATASSMAAQVETAALGAAAAGPILLGPAFGLIGGDFVAAFATAHGGHTAALTNLAQVLGSMSAAAHASAAAYDSADLGVATGLSATGNGLEA
ncbi:type VII secretion target [Rhodococcus sp. NPDC058514]|uniref:type VII secretion target n=1 Tax=unclassified Rhodococcus (in: high G+C Gram-positive bacteria) TaxID=192944 RepID=UPI0036485CFF